MFFFWAVNSCNYLLRAAREQKKAGGCKSRGILKSAGGDKIEETFLFMWRGRAKRAPATNTKICPKASERWED